MDSTIVLHVDHIKAWANGGETVLENLQTLCSKCNLGKSDLEFMNVSAIEVQNA
jgi:5-methylcytosine-specific restriction endonuclease McrA